MQVEELGLFSGGKCNKAVEDKLALEVFDLYVKFKKRFLTSLVNKEFNGEKIKKEHFYEIQKELKESDLYFLLPEYFVLTESISIYEKNRSYEQYEDTTLQAFIVLLGEILDYLKSLIFDSEMKFTDYKHNFRDENFDYFVKFFNESVKDFKRVNNI